MLDDLTKRIQAFPKIKPNSIATLTSFNILAQEFYNFIVNTYKEKLPFVGSYFDAMLVRLPPRLAEQIRERKNARQLQQYPNPMARDKENFEDLIASLNKHAHTKHKEHQDEEVHGLTPREHRTFTTVKSTPRIYCDFCKSSTHNTWDCDANLTLQAKRSIVAEKPLCYMCLRRWTSDHTCAFRCPICKRKHNKLLCTSTRETRTTSRPRSSSYDRQRQSSTYSRSRSTGRFRPRSSSQRSFVRFDGSRSRSRPRTPFNSSRNQSPYANSRASHPSSRNASRYNSRSNSRSNYQTRSLDRRSHRRNSVTGSTVTFAENTDKDKTLKPSLKPTEKPRRRSKSNTPNQRKKSSK